MRHSILPRPSTLLGYEPTLEELLCLCGDQPGPELAVHERSGVPMGVVRLLAARIDWPIVELYTQFGLAPRLIHARHDIKVQGLPCLLVLEFIRTLRLAHDICARSGAEKFDVDHFFGRWLRRPLVALGEQRPMDWLNCPSGAAVVRRTLSAAESGTYL